MIHNDLVHVVVSVCCFSLYCCCVSISCAALELDWIVLNLCVCVAWGRIVVACSFFLHREVVLFTRQTRT